MAFVVTGGCGFIGSHLVEDLVERGHEVIVIDDLSSGFRANLAHVPGVIIHHASVEHFDWSRMEKVEGVFHLAAQASVPYSIDHFVESSSRNMLSTFRVIEFCSACDVPVVYATSSAVYGNLPYGLETGAIELLSPYAADKYCMEMYMAATYNLKRMPSFGLRFFNVYGPRQDPTSPYSGVISIFVDRLRRGLPITINGGSQTRDFVFVKDVARCIYSAFTHARDGGGANIANVLTGTSISINRLVEHLADLMGVTPECEYRSLPLGDPERSSGATVLMEELLNVRIKDFVDIKSGLSRMLAYNARSSTAPE